MEPRPSEQIDPTPRGLQALGDLATPAGFQALRDTLGRLAPDTIAGNERIKNFLAKLGELRVEIPELLRDLAQTGPEEARGPLLRVPEGGAVPQFVRDPHPIDLERVLVVTKQSKVQYDMARYGWTDAQLQEEYARGPEDKTRILKSHQRQMAALDVLSSYISPERIVSRNALRPADIAAASLVIAFGGDNHLQFVSHAIDDETPLWGMNSDPQTSFGALLGGNIKDLPPALGALSRGEYRFEPWTRLRVEIDGRPLPSALCDVYIGERERKYMSRHRLEVTDDTGRKASLEQKSSGMLVITGAGSSGWARSAGRYLHGGDCDFPRESRYSRFLLTEPSLAIPGAEDPPRQSALPTLCNGILLEGESLVVHSLNDSDGIVSIDSLEEVQFPRGRTVTVRLDSQPLWVPVVAL
jgi:NAD kinase